MASDIELGRKVEALLKELGIETPIVPHKEGSIQNARECIASHHRVIMQSLRLNLADDSLAETPNRVAKMYCDEIFTGLSYENFPKCTTVENKFKYDEMLAVDGITVQSMCEHHFLPFVGKATIAYIPKTKVLGLSKFNRISDFFCRRPQIQERLTAQISAALQLILETEDVAVVIRAVHYCAKLRGVKDATSDTVSSKLSGKFRTAPELRSEFLSLARGVK